MFWLIVGILAVILLYKFHNYIVSPFSYWKNKGIDYHLLHDPYTDIFKFVTNTVNSFEEDLANYNGMPDKKVYGIVQFRNPALMIKDPDLLKQVLIKDFDHFRNHSNVLGEEDSVLTRNLFISKDKKWHNSRTILSPVFTANKMRIIFSLMASCGDQIVAYFNKEYEKQGNGKPLEIEFKSTTARFTNDVIATTSFGLEIDSFKNPENEFIKTGRAIFDFSMIRFILLFKFPFIAKIFNVKLMAPIVYEFFPKVIRETLKNRRENNIKRPDMIQLMMEAKESLEKNPVKDLVLEDDDIISQAFVFFGAGFETVSVAMSFAMYELAIHPEIQKRLQEECIENFKKGDGKITYELLQGMKYLDMVVSESFRKWPPATSLDRVCNKKYTLNVDDQEIVIEPEMFIICPVLGIHRDPKYYPNPDKFDPERFNDENKASIHPMTYMPFGAGPRICIASRFAIMEVKLFLCYILANFNLEPTEKTPIPLKIKMSGFTYTAKDGFWIGLKPREQ
uniref:Cytochrome P450 CYP9GP3 n=1 Tax=Chrysoperla zastrowi sillemi TaxID=482137 RepID=A0A9E7YFN6_9NEOP|nr:cytochrome P450 CYP9GP3 [Chrysoperla zastrowi sillemi]